MLNNIKYNKIAFYDNVKLLQKAVLNYVCFNLEKDEVVGDIREANVYYIKK